MTFSARVQSAIAAAAQQTGLDPNFLTRVAQIESSGDPNAVTGSYRGLYQLGSDEWSKYGGGGNIYDPNDNALAGAQKIKDEAAAFTAKYNRDPTPGELYLIHQQGAAGAGAHFANPDGVAWENIRPYYSDAEARRKGFADGNAYAKAAVWGNTPDSVKKAVGSVDNLTSGQFTNAWINKVGGSDAPVAPSFASSGPNEVTGDKPNPLSLIPPQTLAASHPASSGPETLADNQAPLSLLPKWMFQQPPAPSGGTAIAATAGGGGGLLGGILGGTNPLQSNVAEASQAAIPKTPPIQGAGDLRKNIDISNLVAIAQARQKLGTA
jgi:Transglycosylase SLT domain